MFAPRLLPLVLMALFGFSVVLVPVARMRRRTGSTGVVVREAPLSTQRLLSAAGGMLAAGAIAWSALYTVLGPGALGVWPSAPATLLLGLALEVAALVVIFVAQRQMGRSWRVGIDASPTALVTWGFFALVRNPIYAGVGLAAAGLALLTPSPWTLLGCAQAAFMLALQARFEEEHLSRTHGAEYVAYARRVGRFLPGVGRLPRR